MRVILIALDDLYYISFSYSVCLDLSTYLVQKKNTIFDPLKVSLFSEQCGVILVYSGSSCPDLQESYPMSYGISYTRNVAPCTPPRTVRRSDEKTNVRFVISMVYNPLKVIRGTIPFNLTC
jgi:hypothetical protein